MPKGKVKEVFTDPHAVAYLQSGGTIALEETFEPGRTMVLFGIDVPSPDQTYVHAFCANEAVASECLGILPRASIVNRSPEGYPILLVNDINVSGVFDLLTEAGYKEDVESEGG